MARLTVLARDLRVGDVILGSKCIVTQKATVGFDGKAEFAVVYLDAAKPYGKRWNPRTSVAIERPESPAKEEKNG